MFHFEQGYFVWAAVGTQCQNNTKELAYVNHSWGGAAAALRYAIAKKKEIIQLGTLQLSR